MVSNRCRPHHVDRRRPSGLRRPRYGNQRAVRADAAPGRILSRGHSGVHGTPRTTRVVSLQRAHRRQPSPASGRLRPTRLRPLNPRAGGGPALLLGAFLGAGSGGGARTRAIRVTLLQSDADGRRVGPLRGVAVTGPDGRAGVECTARPAAVRRRRRKLTGPRTACYGGRSGAPNGLSAAPCLLEATCPYAPPRKYDNPSHRGYEWRSVGI